MDQSLSLEKRAHQRRTICQEKENQTDSENLSAGSLVGFKSGGAPKAKIILSAKSLSRTWEFQESAEAGYRIRELALLWQNIGGKGSGTIEADKITSATIFKSYHKLSVG